MRKTLLSLYDLNHPPLEDSDPVPLGDVNIEVDLVIPVSDIRESSAPPFSITIRSSTLNSPRDTRSHTTEAKTPSKFLAEPKGHQTTS